jgi:glycosyltransferase involved in cell wall biosynthesis
MNNIPTKLLILIPAFNAAGNLEELISRIKKTVSAAEILVINDGSTDETEAIAKKMDAIVLTNKQNRGKGYSLKRGFYYAIAGKYNHLITIDADLQHRPEEIEFFLERFGNNHISVGTRRIGVGRMPVSRWLSNNLTSLIVSVFGGKLIRDSQSGFRMFNVETLKKMKAESNRFDFESELLLQAGLLNISIVEVPISTIYNKGKSSMNHLFDTGRFIRQIWKRILK